MACSLLIGVIFALIHHFFYQYWSGRKAGDNSQQQWIIRGGTFFAFAFKVSLATGGSVAYAQFLWLSLHTRFYKVRDVDSMFSVLSNPLGFRLLKVWLRHPLLTAVAILVWLIPLAAIIMPGSLTIVLTTETTSEHGRVPSIDFQYHVDNFGETSDAVNGSPELFLEASDDVIRLALASASSGSILSMKPPQPNSTYTTTFPGPALKCSQGSITDLKALGVVNTDYEIGPEGGGPELEYMAWAPGQGSGNPSFEALQMPPFNETDFSSPIQQLSTEGTRSLAPGYNIYIYSPFWENQDGYDWNPFLLQCNLYNVSYAVNFTFESGSQNIQIQSGPKTDLIPLGAPSTYSPGPYGDAPDPSKFNKTISYLSLMYAFGTIVTGSIMKNAELGTQLIQSTTLRSTVVAQHLAEAGVHPTPDNATICVAFEELFQNITFSVFSSGSYLLDPSNPTQAAAMLSPVVTSTQPVNKYTYNALSLWLAYGLALAGELACLAIGFYALHTNRVAYSNDFSSILRATRRKELDRLVIGSEFNGADPTPEHMLDASISYHLSDDRTAGFIVAKNK